MSTYVMSVERIIDCDDLNSGKVSPTDVAPAMMRDLCDQITLLGGSVAKNPPPELRFDRSHWWRPDSATAARADGLVTLTAAAEFPEAAA